MLPSTNHGGMTTALLPYSFYDFSECQFCVFGNREDGFSPESQQNQLSTTDKSCMSIDSVREDVWNRPSGLDSALRYFTAFMLDYLHGTLLSSKLSALYCSKIFA